MEINYICTKIFSVKNKTKQKVKEIKVSLYPRVQRHLLRAVPASWRGHKPNDKEAKRKLLE